MIPFIFLTIENRLYSLIFLQCWKFCNKCTPDTWFSFSSEWIRSWSAGVSYSRIAFCSSNIHQNQSEGLATAFLYSISFRTPWSGNEVTMPMLNWSSHILMSLFIWMTQRTLFSRYRCSSERSMNVDLDKFIFTTVWVIINLIGVKDPFENWIKAIFFLLKKKLHAQT